MTIGPIKGNAKLQNGHRKERRQSKLTLFTIGTTIFLLVYGVFLKGALADEDRAKDYFRDSLPFRPDRSGHGTEHEQAGEVHFKEVQYTPYKAKVNYTNPEVKYKYGMSSTFTTSNAILRCMVSDDPFPEGYVEIRDDKNFYMGRRARNNDWLPVLSKYWLVWLFVAVYLVLLIAMPFVAVCYCCFCCHRRCGRNCPPCDQKPDANRRCCYGILLFLLIIGLLLGVIIAFATNKLLEGGFEKSTKNIRRSSDDTCRFMTNTVNHIKHLYINNYQELETQLVDSLENANTHISIDTTDVSGGDALKKLSTYLDNMPKALKVMIQLDKQEKKTRHMGAFLRDALRGFKRHLNAIRHYWCDREECMKFHVQTDIQHMDIGCLHYDKVPNTTIFVEAIEDMINDDVNEVPKKGLENLKGVGDDIKNLLEVVVPPIVKDIRAGAPIMKEQAMIISSLVNKVISDVHLRSAHTAHSFDDIYSKLGTYRNLTNVLLCSIILIIIICLIIGLCYGCFAKQRHGYHDTCCNKGTGAIWLLVAMLLIFITFSIITLVGLFYFIFGLLAYQGACAPLRDNGKNNIFVAFDSLIDFQKIPLPGRLGYAGEGNTENPLPPIRLSYALNACRSNESIIDVLQLNKLYSIQNLKMLKVVQKIIDDSSDPPKFTSKLEGLVILSEEDMNKLREMATGNLSMYRSHLYKQHMCKDVTNSRIHNVVSGLRTVNSYLDPDSPKHGGFAYKYAQQDLQEYIDKLYNPLMSDIKQLHRLAQEVDNLILWSGSDFGSTVERVLTGTMQAEKFLRSKGAQFITEVTKNLTQHIIREVERYKNYVIYETENNVGRCKPLAYIYENDVDIVCSQLVDPMNGFWLGLLLCSLLFLPTLFVAHKLQCLYKKVGLYVTPAATSTCPACTGKPGPIQPRTIMVCSGGLGKKSCPCPSQLLSQKVSQSGDFPSSGETVKAHRSPRRKRGGLTSQCVDFFDVEAQQSIVYRQPSQAFAKRKTD